MFAKKSLGQHFLISEEIVQEIVQAAHVGASDNVLEIGPGRGVLTEQLLKTGAKVLAIEKDDHLVGFLKEKFDSFIEKGKFELIHGDILKFGAEHHELLRGEYKLVANIPYYITGEVLRQFLTSRPQPSQITLLVQKEVAERITAEDKESILSLSAKAYGNPKYIRTVTAEHFSPPPRVDSAILRISDLSMDFFTTIAEEDFFKVIKTAFAHKRKVVVNNLETLAPKEKIIAIFNDVHLPLQSRAETISLQSWKEITRKLFS